MKGEQTALMMAAQGGHVEVVKALIEAGVGVNLRKWVCYLGMAYVSMIVSFLGLLLPFYMHVE